MNFTQYLQLKGYSSTTMTTYEEAVTAFTQWCAQERITDLTEVSHNDMVAYIKNCNGRGVSPRTIAHYLRSIRHYYDYLIKTAVLIENPCSQITIKGIKRKIVYDIIPYEKLELLYNRYTTDTVTASNTTIRKRNKAMLGLLIYQGLQSEELRRLEVGDLKLREGKITIHAGNRSAGRTMPLEAHQIYELMDYLNDTRKALLQQTGKTPQEITALFITAAKGHPVASNTMHTLLQQLRELYPELSSLNQLRASVIVHWLKRYHLRKVQHLAGHKYISSTEAYQSSNLDDLKEDIAKYHPF